MDMQAMPEQLKVALIYGSTREGRYCDTVVTWAAEQIWSTEGFDLDVIDPQKMQLPTRHESQAGQAVMALRQRLDRADAFIVVTPEYNHSFPVSLKFLI